MVSNSRISRSSSMTSTVCLLIGSEGFGECSQCNRPGGGSKGCCSCAGGQRGGRSRARRWRKADPEAAAAARDAHVFKRGLVGFGHLPGQVKPQSRAVFVRREERFEDLRGHLRGD